MSSRSCKTRLIFFTKQKGLVYDHSLFSSNLSVCVAFFIRCTVLLAGLMVFYYFDNQPAAQVGIKWLVSDICDPLCEN